MLALLGTTHRRRKKCLVIIVDGDELRMFVHMLLGFSNQMCTKNKRGSDDVHAEAYPMTSRIFLIRDTLSPHKACKCRLGDE